MVALSALLHPSCFVQVANVRFNVAKFLKAVSEHLSPQMIESAAMPVLKKLSADDDVDVRYYADVTIQEFNSRSRQDDVVMTD